MHSAKREVVVLCETVRRAGRGREVCAITTILVLAAALRAWRIGDLFPILVDEAIYTRWAEIIDRQGQWFISLLDGKQPLSYWLLALERKVWDADPLVAARLLSVASGAASTFLLYLIGRRVAGPIAGLTTALLYALLPYGLLYDRLAYTDSFVNMLGIASVWAALEAFQDRPRRLAPLLAGLLLGLSYFTKSTAIQFFLAPLAVALVACPPTVRYASRFRQLVMLYVVAASFIPISWLAMPDAPRFPYLHPLLHHTSLFTPGSYLLAHPLHNLLLNGVALGQYLASYLTVPVLAAAAVGLALSTQARPILVALLATATLAPLLVQVFSLEYFPTRYPFPHVWTLLLVVGVGTQEIARRWDHRQTWLRTAALAAVVFLSVGAVRFVADPRSRMPESDAEDFLGSGPYAGFGVREAIAFLEQEAARGPFALLTDPAWGTPADAFYPYMHRMPGARAYDAWWLQLSPTQPILPAQPIEVMKSQYERVLAVVVEFSAWPVIYYVTDTNYNTPEAVMRREPSARLVARFHKPDAHASIDLYRIK